MTDEETRYILNAIREITENHWQWAKDYNYIPKKNEFMHQSHLEEPMEEQLMKGWFDL